MMRALLVALMLAVLAGCGGGSSSSSNAQAATPAPAPPAAAPTSIDRYIPMFMGGARLKGIIQKLDSGEHYTDWRVDSGRIWWSATDAELFDVRVCKGIRWSFLIAFVDDARGATYGLENVRTTRNDVDLDCPQTGAPYQPFDIPLDFQDTVEQWGYVLVPEGKLPYYWKARFTYGTTAENPCWIGAGPKTRLVIVQDEVWWDQRGGWARGHPINPAAVPWLDDRPVRVDVAMEWQVKNAVDAGILWRGGDKDLQLCMRDVVTW